MSAPSFRVVGGPTGPQHRPPQAVRCCHDPPPSSPVRIGSPVRWVLHWLAGRRAADVTEGKPRRTGVTAAGMAFMRRQQRDWMVTVVRTSLDRLAYQMVFPYLSIYIIALGATATQLGLVNSLGMLVAGLAGPFTGWLIDRHGPRSFYLVGIAMLAVAYLTYALAQSWGITILAMIAYWLGYSISSHSCATICGNCLANQDRATGMTICETVAAGLLGIVGPILGTVIVVSSGHVDASAIRPLFFIAFAITVASFVFILTQLSGQRWGARGTGRAVFRDLGEVLREGQHLKRWLAIAAIGQLPVGMVFAFSSVYAHEVKGADAVVLGGMAAAAAVGSIALAVPLGRIADRIGRKRVLYATIPLFSLSCLVLVWAPGPVALLAAGSAPVVLLHRWADRRGDGTGARPGSAHGPVDRDRAGREDAGQRDARAGRRGHLGPGRARSTCSSRSSRSISASGSRCS